MKIISKFIIFTFVVFTLLVGYLSFVGFETKRFNDQITKKIKRINQKIDIDLNEIKIVLNLFELKLEAKTLGSKLRNNNRILEIENISTQIPLKSLFTKNVLIENLQISTKSIKIKDLISFARIINQNPELFVLEKIVKKGFLLANINLNFDESGNIKKNYKIKGLIKDAKIDIIKKYKIDNLNLDFNYKKDTLNFQNINLIFNDLNFYSKKLNFTNVADKTLIEGEIENKNFILDNKNTQIFVKSYFPNLDVKKIELSSKNNFAFKINKKFQLSDLKFTSKVKLKEFLFVNNIKAQNFFPELNKEIKLTNHEINIDYKKKTLELNGLGKILLQNNNDEINYSIKKINNRYDFKTSIKIKKNPFVIDILDFQKNDEDEMLIDVSGSKKINGKTILNLFSIRDEKSRFHFRDIILNKKLKITDLESVDLDYVDQKNNLNKLNLISKDDIFLLKGTLFNADKFVENLINDDDKLDIIQKNFKLNIKIDELILDDKNRLKNFEGLLTLENQKIISGRLIGSFSNDKKLKFTVDSRDNEKITTLFLDKAEAIVSRYKFIKGFDEGILDFYSSKKGNESVSTLKIYDFKLKELPTLTKLLTLASLQGIADLLSGEGIRFNEFEMNFRNKKNLMTVDEIYAIGPAISILMEGYIEKNKLVSLRGTLVPATTINKAIGSIPVLGQILVGSKTGEGVFGVSFKIKGPPKSLETNVNPIKTLTPRFITRTLEKIKKN